PRKAFLGAKEPKIEFQCPPGVPSNFPGFQTLEQKPEIQRDESKPEKEDFPKSEDALKLEKLKQKFATQVPKKATLQKNITNPYFEEVYDDYDPEFDQTFLESESELEEIGTIHTLDSLRAMEASEV
ncbi:MAG: hypothetical protein SFU25_08895, partial [Candidatus Caenarcaniphilales bacterium]|nr:hypothetical protein [Candidatus Caenarcaniphilales bacterium]